MDKIKLNIQKFAEVQIMTEKKGGSGPPCYYQIWGEVTGRTSTTVTIKFRLKAYIKKGSSWGKTSALYGQFFVYGQEGSQFTIKSGSANWGSGPHEENFYPTMTVTDISPTLTSIPATNIRFKAWRNGSGSTGPIDTKMTAALPIPIGQLPINFNGSEGITAVNFNGNNVEHLYFNGTQIF